MYYYLTRKRKCKKRILLSYQIIDYCLPHKNKVITTLITQRSISGQSNYKQTYYSSAFINFS